MYLVELHGWAQLGGYHMGLLGSNGAIRIQQQLNNKGLANSSEVSLPELGGPGTTRIELNTTGMTLGSTHIIPTLNHTRLEWNRLILG
jgi:hypothetical protein